MKPSQFRVLFREFLFRTVDIELLSQTADSSKLMGQIAALLVFFSFWLGLGGFGIGGIKNLPPQKVLMIVYSGEHFLIATTMLATGLLAVLSWNSTYPNKRDVFVLAPLPISTSTFFLAKISAVAAALGLTVVTFHCFAGLTWPVGLHMASITQATAVLTYEPSQPPADIDAMKAMLDRQLAHSSAAQSGAGMVVGLYHRGRREVFTYGAAHADSLFEIGSLTKTFTGLILAKQAVRDELRLHQPVRELLPDGLAPKAAGGEITLLDLATHRSALPPMPDNFKPASQANPLADYGPPELFAYLAKHGFGKPRNPPFEYSNLGFGLLGEALARHSGSPFAELMHREITGPLGMNDTVIQLSAEQQQRLMQGYNLRLKAIQGWDMNVFAGAGGLRSTAGDMLKFLETQLHPNAAFYLAIGESHKPRAPIAEDTSIGLAWIRNGKDGTYWHNGGTAGFSSYAFFHPQGDYAAVVLVNQSPGVDGFANLAGEHVRSRFGGEPAISLDKVIVQASGGITGLLRNFLAYWFTMFASGAFIYCCMLALQGVIAQLLPRRWFLQISSLLQLGAFTLLLAGYMLQPAAVTPAAILDAQNKGAALYWSPSYWFLGLMQQLNGSPAMAPLAHKAWLGLAVALSLTAVAYALSYFRTMRKIVEEPDIVALSGRINLLPRFGNSLTTAIAQFSIRTLLRSREHRLILAFYWGVAMAFVIFNTKAPAVQQQLLADDDPWRQANVPLLVATSLILCAAIVGMRMVISIPIELKANWSFQSTPLPQGARIMRAIRTAMYLLGPTPVWLASAGMLYWLWPWREAAIHLAVLLLLGTAVTEVCLGGFRKIPFTCSYLPGKSRANMAVLAYLAVVALQVKAAQWERHAMENPNELAFMLGVLALAAILARWWAGGADAVAKFEDSAIPVVEALNLHLDGTSPVETRS